MATLETKGEEWKAIPTQ